MPGAIGGYTLDAIRSYWHARCSQIASVQVTGAAPMPLFLAGVRTADQPGRAKGAIVFPGETLGGQEKSSPWEDQSLARTLIAGPAGIKRFRDSVTQPTYGKIPGATKRPDASVRRPSCRLRTPPRTSDGPRPQRRRRKPTRPRATSGSRSVRSPGARLTGVRKRGGAPSTSPAGQAAAPSRRSFSRPSGWMKSGR